MSKKLLFYLKRYLRHFKTAKFFHRKYINLEASWFKKISSGLVVNRYGTEFWIDSRNNTDVTFASKRYEIETNDFLKSILNNQDIVVEIGANVGTQSFLIASLIAPHGMVYSVEPSEYGVGMLKIRRSTSEYKDNIKIIEAFCTDSTKNKIQTSCLARFPHNEDGFNRNIEEIRGAEYISIDQIINSLVGQKDRRKLILIKIDVDGPELNCLKGGIKSISKYKPFILIEISAVCLIKYNHTPKDIYEFMEELGYIYSYSIMRKTITDLKDVENNIKDGSHDDIVFFDDLAKLNLN